MTEQRFDIIFGFSADTESQPASGIQEGIAWSSVQGMIRHSGGYCKVRHAGSDEPWTTIRAKREKVGG